MKENGFTQEKARNRRYPTRIITDTDYADDTALLANTPVQVESQLHRLEQAAGGISLHLNAGKTEHMSFNQSGDISTLNGSSLKLVHLPRKQYLSTKNDIKSDMQRHRQQSIGYSSYWSQTYSIKA